MDASYKQGEIRFEQKVEARAPPCSATMLPPWRAERPWHQPRTLLNCPEELTDHRRALLPQGSSLALGANLLLEG